MAALRPKKNLALDTNLLLDLAAEEDFAHTFREVFSERGYTLLAPPTVIEELTYAGKRRNPRARPGSRKGHYRQWQCSGLNPILFAGNLPRMKTLTVDDYHRVKLPGVEPRTKFAYERDAHGRITLTKLEPVQERPARVRFAKRNGRTVGITDRPISLRAIKRALAEFP